MARYTVETPDGTKRKTLYRKTRKEAADRLTEALAARNRGALTFDSEDFTVGEYLDRWLENIRVSVKPVSWENYERNIRLHLKPALGNVKQAKLTPGRIQALHNRKRSMEALRRHRIDQNEERLKAGASWADNDLIFPTRKGALMPPSTITDDHFKPLLERVGLPRCVRFHNFRHTAATLLLGRASETCAGTIGAFVHCNYAG